MEPLELASTYLFEGGFGIEIVNFAADFNSLVRLSQSKETTDEALQDQVERMKNISNRHFKDYHMPIDKKIMENIPTHQYFIMEQVFKKSINYLQIL